MIKYYTNNKRYMGQVKKRSFKLDFLELSSWITSGNYIIYNNMKLSSPDQLQNIYR